MDRAPDSGSGSWGFESLRACQKQAPVIYNHWSLLFNLFFNVDYTKMSSITFFNKKTVKSQL